MMKYKNYWHLIISNPIYIVVFLLLSINSSVLFAQQTDLGSEIYTKGLSEHKVDMGDGFDAPAQLFPCANCHGQWGQGSQESGIYAPNITWQQLTKPYDLQSTQGRQRQAYDLASFNRVLLDGVDSSGNTLASIMPRYDYNKEQIHSLWLSLKNLSDPQINGIETNRISIGVVLANSPYRQTIITLLRTYFQQINNNGGIFQRQIHLLTDKTPAFKSGCCIAMLTFEVSDLPQWARHLPNIVVFSSLNEPLKNTHNSLFALYPGAEHRSEILRTYSNNKINEEYSLMIKPPGIELVTKRGQAEYLDLVNSSGIELQWISEQLWMLSATKLLLHVLNRVGRDVDSQKLINGLTDTHDYHTHLGPPLSFGPQRFIGAKGIMIKNSIDNKWLWYQPKVLNH